MSYSPEPIETPLPPLGPAWNSPPAELPTRREELAQREAIVALGRRALADPEQTVLMRDAAVLLAQSLGLEDSGVAELSADGRRLQLQLELRHGGDPLAAQSVAREIDAAANGSLAGYAVHRAQPVAVADLREEKRFRDATLSECQIAAAVAVPLTGLGKSFGALLAGSRSPRPFSPADLLFAETIAHLVTSTIGRRRAEAALDAQRRYTQCLVESAQTLILLLDREGRLVQVNPAAQRISSFTAEQILGQKLWDALAVPDDAAVLENVARQCLGQGQPTHLETGLQTRDRHTKHVAWTFAPVTMPTGKPECILATGIDVTARYEAEEQVRCLEQLVVEQTAAAAKAERRGGGVPLAERRARPRRPYPYHQLIAAVINGELPPRDRFSHVRCHDIASGGFSFSSPTPPSVDAYVVALGHPPNLTYIIAQVVHVTRVEQDGQRSYLVGCSYSTRVTY